MLDISLVMATTLLLCTSVVLVAVGVVPFAIAQQEEEASLGEDSLADGIVSDVLDDHNVVDQGNTAEQDAINLGLQDQDATQEEELAQDADNTNMNSDLQVGGQQPPRSESPTRPPATPGTPGTPGEPGPPGPEPPVQDTTPPTLTVPEDMVVEATSTEGAQVRFTVTAEDNVEGTAILDENNMLIQDNVGGIIRISCDPSSGSTFPIGETVVRCTATDEASNTATASFTITVQEPAIENGKIAFTSLRDGNVDVYTMNPDGSEQINISKERFDDRDPSWSPDGTKIAFARIVGGDSEVYVMNADGTEQTNITNNPAIDSDPDWTISTDTDP